MFSRDQGKSQSESQSGESSTAPFIDSSRFQDDSASFVSTLPPPSYHTVEDNNNNSDDDNNNGTPQYTRSPQLATPSAAGVALQDGAEDKIIMTSIAVNSSGSGSTTNISSPAPKKGLFGRLRPKSSPKLKIVLMPQSEYARHFATDKAGNYIGTEPQREWSAEELDERYAVYKNTLPKAPMRGGHALTDGGGLGAIAAFGIS